MKAHFDMLAHYNAWANRRLYDAAAVLSDAEYRANRGAFFKSMHGTLNHLLVGDRIWMRRFTGEGEAPTRLDAILYEDFAELRRMREAEDARILRFVAGLDETDLAGRFRRRTTSRPVEIEQPLAPALAHFYNHRTRHGGQAHGLLTGFGRDAPSLDLILFQRQTGIGLN